MVKTSNIIEAVLLYIEGYKITSVRSLESNANIAEFEFACTPSKEWIDRFKMHQILVEPNHFTSVYKMLTTMAKRVKNDN